MADIQELMAICNDKGASDLHLSVGRAPVFRLNGRLKQLETEPLDGEALRSLADAIMPDRLRAEFEEKGTVDFAHAFEDKARFRVSIFNQKGNVGVAMRLIPSRLMSFDDIGLPDHVKDLLVKPRGLVLVTGPTGSGKTTTLATMIV